MTRLITYDAVVDVISDVFVETSCRGLGLGKFLVASVREHPEAQGLRRIPLATNDAHDLYRRYGFDTSSNPDRWMELSSTSRRSKPPT